MSKSLPKGRRLALSPIHHVGVYQALPAPSVCFLIGGRKEKPAANETHSFLLVTEKDVGDLLMLRFKWEDASSWSPSGALKMVRSWWGGRSGSAPTRVRKIRVRAGETQQRWGGKTGAAGDEGVDG